MNLFFNFFLKNTEKVSVKIQKNLPFLPFTRSKLIIETLEQGAEYVQS